VLPGGALGPGIARGTFGLFLLPTGRPGRCFNGTDDEDPTASGDVLFLLPRGRPRPRRGTEVQTGPICISHGDKLAEKKP
jgi:hypothetical protein